MANIFDSLIPVVNAQTLDSISQPTFGTIDIGTQGGAVSTVLLSSTSTATQIGQKFKVSIEIKTNDQQINQYKILVDFDSSKLTVVDQDSATLGTQIKLLDTVFTVSNPQTNNNVSNTGRITLLANTSSGNGFSVNRIVAEIEFQAQQIGAASIKVVQGSVGTQLLRTNGTTLSFTPNELSVQISAAQSNSGNTNTGNTNNGGTQTGNTGSTGGTTQVPTVIPNTAFEDYSSLVALGGGVFFVILGAVLLKTKPKRRSLEQ